MKTLFVFLAGYCTAEIISHLVFYYGGALPFKAFGQNIDVSFNTKALIFYGVLALVFYFLAFKK